VLAGLAASALQSRAVPIEAGVLALQGAYQAHAAVLGRLGCAVREVRAAADLTGLQALCMPGGESTTMSLLLDTSGLRGPLRRALAPDMEGGAGLPVLATCAGMILLARQVTGDTGSRRVDSLGLLDATVNRNGFGRQIESFETELEVDWAALGEGVPAATGSAAVGGLHGVFIRAPRVEAVGKGVQVAATLNGEPVLLRQGNIIAASFHPELSGDPALHAALVQMAAARS
jgi:5'-phosphate synthase pdxT subunit